MLNLQLQSTSSTLSTSQPSAQTLDSVLKFTTFAGRPSAFILDHPFFSPFASLPANPINRALHYPCFRKSSAGPLAYTRVKDGLAVKSKSLSQTRTLYTATQKTTDNYGQTLYIGELRVFCSDIRAARVTNGLRCLGYFETMCWLCCQCRVSRKGLR